MARLTSKQEALRTEVNGILGVPAAWGSFNKGNVCRLLWSVTGTKPSKGESLADHKDTPTFAKKVKAVFKALEGKEGIEVTEPAPGTVAVYVNP